MAKPPISQPLEELRAKARAIQSERTSEPVWIDLDTYERLVKFIQTERCSLDEALRRAVRIGVQVLLVENTPATQVDYEGLDQLQVFHRPEGQAFTHQVSEYEPPPLNFADGTTNFAAVPPPGMF